MKYHKITKNLMLARKCYSYKIPLISKIIWIFNRIIFCCDIPVTVKLGENV